MYSFKNYRQINGLIGSANLTCFWDSTERTYETMLHLDGKVAQMLQADIQNTIHKLGKNIQEVERPSTFIEHNSHLENCLGVQKIVPEKIRQLFAQKSEYHFSIPAKTEEKSNLNVFFGEGRRDKRGFVKPRPWYEVELIVSKDITSQEGYPILKSFTVITDDGWQFQCKTSGDYSKNFRSENDLKTLGKWIKGRLENRGCLQNNEKITHEPYVNTVTIILSSVQPTILMFGCSHLRGKTKCCKPT